MNKKIKKIIFGIESIVPYIPNFNNYKVILAISSLTFFITLLFSIVSSGSIFSLFIEFMNNIICIIPYLFGQILLLIFFAKKIKNITPIKSIFLIFFLNIVSVWFIYSLINMNFLMFFNEFQKSFSILLTSIIILFLNIIYFDWKHKSISPSELTSRLSFLQSKMQPHFLFNTLNTITALINRDNEKAQDMLINLATIIRASLSSKDIMNIVTIGDEIKIAESYLEIEKVRFSSKLVYEFKIEDEILNYKVPKFIIQPLLENAILHGVSKLENGGKVTLKIYKNIKNELFIEISNPYNPKYNPSIKQETNKITLQNLKERLKILYRNEASININQSDNMFYVSIKIPFDNIEEYF